MTLQEKALYLYEQGYTLGNLYDVMNQYDLQSVDEAIEWEYNKLCPQK